MMGPRKKKMTKKAERTSPPMTAWGNATHHEPVAVMVYRCPVTAKKAMVPTEMVMASHPDGLGPSEWLQNPAIAARTLGLTSSLDRGYLQLTGKSKEQFMAWDGSLITSTHHVSSGKKGRI